jgi:hypothetical protein
LFTDSKYAEIKENQEIGLEKTDDIHDVMVSPCSLVLGSVVLP